MALCCTAVMLNAVTMPVVVEAGVSRETRLQTTSTMEFFTRDGRVALHFAGSRGLTNLAASLRTAREIDSDLLSNARANMVKLSRIKGENWQGLSMSIQILDALRAPSDEGYRAAMDEIPITVTRTKTQDDMGRDGLRLVFALRDTIKASVFLLGGDAASFASSEPSPEEQNEFPESAAVELRTPETPIDWCEITDPENMYYGEEGDCATTQELEDATISVIAWDEEMTDIEEESEVDYLEWFEWCEDFYSYSECAYIAQPETAAVDISADFEPEGDLRSSSDDPPPCTWKKSMLGMSITAWGIAKVGIWAAITVTNPVGWIVGLSVAGGVLATIAIADSAVGLQQCIHQV